MVYAMAETKSGPLSPKKPVKEKIVGIYDDFFKVIDLLWFLFYLFITKCLMSTCILYIC